MYEGKRIYLSIGAVQVPDVKKYIKRAYTVVAYEPEKIAFTRYQNFVHPNFFCFNKAVSDFDGKTILYFSGGGSTIFDKIDPGDYPDEKYEVDVVSLSSILKSVLNVKILHINCEGSEIPIIMGTPLDLFERCSSIWIEFHGIAHYPKLGITDEMIDECVEKLKASFKAKDFKTYHPYWQFRQK